MPDRKQNEGSDGLVEDEASVPSQGGTSGGRLQREIGVADEEQTGMGADPQPSSVHKSQKPDGGDEPTLPNRSGPGPAKE